MVKKHCKKCYIKYSELENYCTKCGIELENEPNKCSEMKTTRCERREFKDDDVYCSYCGNLTVYAVERNKIL